MKKYILPGFLLSVPSILSTLINNAFYEEILFSGYMFFLGIIIFLCSFFIMLFLVKKIKKADPVNFNFKKSFGHCIKIVGFWSLFNFIINYVYYLLNTELIKKIAKSALEFQKQRAISNNGTISAGELKNLERIYQLQISPLYTASMGIISVFLMGLLFSLIISAILKTRTE